MNFIANDFNAVIHSWHEQHIHVAQGFEFKHHTVAMMNVFAFKKGFDGIQIDGMEGQRKLQKKRNRENIEIHF